MAQTVIAFDLYGTLLSTDSIATELSKMYGEGKAKALAARARTLQLEYTWRCNSMKKYQSFSDVTRWSFRHATAEQDLKMGADDEERLMQAYNGLDTFPDASAGLGLLANSENVAVYVFSNGDPSMLAASMSTSRGLAYGESILPASNIISVQPLGAFKPDPGVYRHFLDVVGKKDDPSSVWLVSSNPFDTCGAVAAGWKSAWVDRAGKGWLDGLGNGTGYNPTIVTRGVDEAVEAILRVSQA